MLTNRISVEWSEEAGLEAKVYDNDGVEHDITPIFQKMSGATGVGTLHSVIEVGSGTTGTKIEFRPESKELIFNTSAKVINQILEALA